MRLLVIILLMSSICNAQEFEGNFIKAKANGGTAPFTYSLNNGAYQSKDTFFNVQPGVHIINAKDKKNCVKSSICTLYTNLSMKALVWDGTQYIPYEQYIPTSNNFLSVKLNATGGKSPYYFSRNSTTNYIQNKIFWNGLGKNTPYTFRVKDALGYIQTIIITF